MSVHAAKSKSTQTGTAISVPPTDTASVSQESRARRDRRLTYPTALYAPHAPLLPPRDPWPKKAAPERAVTAFDLLSEGQPELGGCRCQQNRKRASVGGALCP